MKGSVDPMEDTQDEVTASERVWQVQRDTEVRKLEEEREKLLRCFRTDVDAKAA